MTETRETCGACQRPFDPTDTRHDGHAQDGESRWCRHCVDRCHESTDFAHQCVICRAGDEPAACGEGHCRCDCTPGYGLHPCGCDCPHDVDCGCEYCLDAEGGVE